MVAANFLIDAESNLKAAIGGFGSGTAAPAAAPAKVGHKAHGSVVAIDAKAGTLSIRHDPVAEPQVAGDDHGVRAGESVAARRAEAGQPFDFEFVERKPGEWVITSIAPRRRCRPKCDALRSGIGRERIRA